MSLVVVAVFLALERVRWSPYGRVLRAVRDDDQVAAGAGKPVLAFIELIASLGCASVLNLPVIHESGRILGTVDLPHEEGWYEEADIPVGQVFAAMAVPAFRRLAC